MWRLLSGFQRAVGLKCSIDTKAGGLAAVLPQDVKKKHEHSSDVDTFHVTKYCEFRDKYYSDQNDRHGKRDRRRKGSTEQDFKERWNACRHDMWRCNSSWHFLEAVGWGTAVVLGLQVTELCHQRSKWKCRNNEETACSCLLLKLKEVASNAASLWSHTHTSIIARNVLPHSTGKITLDHCLPASLSTGNCLPGSLPSGSSLPAEGQTCSLPWSSALPFSNINAALSDSQIIKVAADLYSSTLPKLNSILLDDSWQHKSDLISAHSDDDPSSNCIQHCETDLEAVVDNRITYNNSTAISSCAISNNSAAASATTAATADAAAVKKPKSLSCLQKEFDHLFCSYWSLEENSRAISLAKQDDMKEAVNAWKHILTYSTHCDKALFNLGVCYQLGLGELEKDLNQAKEFYQKAANLGNAKAMYNLAQIVMQRNEMQSVKMQNAITLLTKAAEQGLPEAQRELGVIKVEMNSQSSLTEAVDLFESAAKQNDTLAMYYLGLCYERGLGVETNENKAAQCYKQAAMKGHPESFFNLACFYQFGRGGLTVSDELALELYKYAESKGVMESRERIEALQEIIPSPTCSVSERNTDGHDCLNESIERKAPAEVLLAHSSSSRRSLFRCFSTDFDLEDSMSDEDWQTEPKKNAKRSSTKKKSNKMSFNDSSKLRGGIFLDFSSSDDDDDVMFEIEKSVKGLHTVASGSSIVFEDVGLLSEDDDERYAAASHSIASIN